MSSVPQGVELLFDIFVGSTDRTQSAVRPTPQGRREGMAFRGTWTGFRDGCEPHVA